MVALQQKEELPARHPSKLVVRSDLVNVGREEQEVVGSPHCRDPRVGVHARVSIDQHFHFSEGVKARDELLGVGTVAEGLEERAEQGPLSMSAVAPSRAGGVGEARI